MSRSKGNRKTTKAGRNIEYWSRRPYSNGHGAKPCRWVKTMTHRCERRIADRELRELSSEVELDAVLLKIEQHIEEEREQTVYQATMERLFEMLDVEDPWHDISAYEDPPFEDLPIDMLDDYDW